MSAPAEQDMKPATADAIRFMGTTFAIPSFVSLADALDALAAAHRGCNAVICTYPSGYEQRCTTEYLCGACDERRESAISTLTGAPRP